jgi:hypothetical protein
MEIDPKDDRFHLRYGFSHLFYYARTPNNDPFQLWLVAFIFRPYKHGLAAGAMEPSQSALLST